MLGHTPSAPPRCKSPKGLRPFMFMTFTCTGDMTGSLPINLLPVLVTFQALSNKHNCLFDSVTYVAWLCHVCDMTGSSLNNIIVSLCICHLTDMAYRTCGIILSHLWHAHRDDDNVYHHQLNFIMFTCVQIPTSWCQEAIAIFKLEFKTPEYILSFIVTAHNMSYIVCYT